MQPFRYIHAPPASDGELTIETIGFHQCRSKFYRSPRVFPAYRIMMFHTAVTVELDGDTVAGAPHTLYLFDRHTPVSYGRASGRWSHSWLRLRGPELPSFFAEHSLPLNTPIPFPSARASDRYLPLLRDELRAGSVPDKHLIRHLLHAWLRKIQLQFQQGSALCVPLRLTELKHRLEAQFLAPVTLADLAQTTGLSRTYLCTQFRRHFGIAPIAYVLQLRMRYAAELLEDANCNVTEAARECGYNDIYYFSRLFKKVMGASPRAYRRGK